MPQNPTSNDWFQAGSPLYLEVRRRIAEAIRNGEWRPGEALPNEKRLCQRFGVSMGTLRKAVDELTAAGVLIRQQGRGTFVTRHSQDRYLFSFFHLVAHDGHKEYPKVHLVAFKKTVADAQTAQLLALKTGAPLLHLSNTQWLAGKLAALDEITLPAALFKGLDENRLRARQTTLYQLYQDEFDVVVVRTAERVRACAATQPRARLLGTEPGTPLLQIIRVAYSFESRPVELRYTYVNTRHCEYRPDFAKSRKEELASPGAVRLR